MNVWQSIISGIVQGIAEFFPISSTGHLVLLHHFFGFDSSQISFDIALHVATGLAVLVYFWRDIISLFTSERNLGMLVLVGSVPTFIIGFLFAHTVEKFFVDIKLVGYALLVTGVWLLAANIVNKKILHNINIQKKATVLYPWKAIAIGTAQGIALIPGISRSGATISTGLLCGLGSNLAFRFSFLLLLPATLGATVYKLKNITQPIPSASSLLYGCISAFFVGLLALYLLNKILRQGRIYIFGFYCLALGALVILL
jgi:undecaprenyl-diphosphatase